jgi:hypothetical protein
MPSFDIETLLNFKPARHLCEKCYALLQKVPVGSRDASPSCPVCKVRYEPTDHYGCMSLSQYLKDSGYYLPIDNPTEHGRSLAAISSLLRRNQENYPPLRALFQALNTAKHFVHFTTFGISHLLIGVLKMTSQRVPVRGIVSNVEATVLSELSKFPNEAPQFKVKTFGTEAKWSEMPHQKLVVIDGLLAFKGSANLTLNAWRKAAKGRDIIEVATDVNEVIELHNRFFASLWGELSDRGDAIEMMEGIPF